MWLTISLTHRIQHPRRRGDRFAGRAKRAAALYAIGALVWISTSDLVVDALDIDNTWVNIGKGYLFVVTTSLLLWAAFRRHEHELGDMIASLERAAKERNDALEGTTRTVGAMIEARDPYTAGHQQRVGDLAARIGRAMGLDDERIEGLRIGGYLHDVGKVVVPPDVLTRPGPLTADEYALVQTHALRGYEILSPVPFLWPVAQIARQHHERVDGSGYPDGLRGDDIIIEARIVAVADTFDAITSARPYRPARTPAEALAEIERGAPALFDPNVVDALRTLLQMHGL